MHVPLIEMNCEDAAAHATKVFIDVGPLDLPRTDFDLGFAHRLLCRRNRGNADSIQLPLNIRRYRARLQQPVPLQHRRRALPPRSARSRVRNCTPCSDICHSRILLQKVQKHMCDPITVSKKPSRARPRIPSLFTPWSLLSPTSKLLGKRSRLSNRN